jgi:hypothetical protein
MNRIDVLTLVFFLITIVYLGIFGWFLQRSGEKLFYRAVIKMAPGLIFLILLFAWVAFGFSVWVLALQAILLALLLALYAFLVQTSANWLSRVPGMQKWRKNLWANLITRHNQKGRDTRKLQEHGSIPDNTKLAEFGFTQEELRNLGLLD